MEDEGKVRVTVRNTSFYFGLHGKEYEKKRLSIILSTNHFLDKLAIKDKISSKSTSSQFGPHPLPVIVCDLLGEKDKMAIVHVDSISKTFKGKDLKQ